MAKKTTPSYGIYVGHCLETTQEISKTILNVLAAPHADERTKQKALSVLTDVFKIQGVSITNCAINMKPDD